MNKIVLALLYIIISAVAQVSVISVAQANEITLPASVSVSDEKIYLNDIIKIDNIDNAYISMSPLPGNKKNISRRYIERIVKNLISDTVVVLGSDQVVITREAQPLDENVVKTVLFDRIISELANKNIDKNNVSIEISDIKYNKMLPLGDVKYEASFSKNEDFQGNIITNVTISVDNKSYDKFTARANIRVWDTVLRTKKNIRFPNKLTADDVYSDTIEVTNIRGKLIKNINELQTKIVKTLIVKETVLTDAQFKNEPLFRTGDRIQIISKAGNVSVSTLGLAKENGYENQIVRVENFSSKKIVRGKAISNNAVIIE